MPYPAIWVIAGKEPVPILLHGLKTAAMVVKVRSLGCILHTLIGGSTPNLALMDGLHLIRVVDIVLSCDDYLGLPVSVLQRVPMLRAEVADGGSKLRLVAHQHTREQSVVVSVLVCLHKLVPGGPSHLWDNLWVLRRRCRTRRRVGCRRRWSRRN